MAEMLHPDVYVKEIGGVPILLGVGTGTGCFIGTCPSGPTDAATLVTNYSQFVTKYGTDGEYLDESVKAFFDNGGTRCYIIRVVGAGAYAATNDIGDMNVDALYVGTSANGQSVTTTRYTVALAAAQTITSASDNVTLADASDVELGDMINFWDSNAVVTITVADIDGDEIYFKTPTVTGTISTATTTTGGFPGYCATVHKLSTKTSAALAAATAVSTLTLNSVGALEAGDSVTVAYYDSGTGNSEDFVREVDSINGNDVTLTASLTPTYTGVYNVTSIEFDTIVSQGGSVIESLRTLSANGNSPSFYGTVVNATTGTQNISSYVELSYTGAGTSAGDNVPILNIAVDNVIASDLTLDTFTFAGDIRGTIGTGETFVISGSTGNDGSFTVDSTALTSGNTVISTVESVTDDVGDGVGTFTRAADYDGGAVTLAYGLDGSTPDSAAYIGTEVAPRSGMGIQT